MCTEKQSKGEAESHDGLYSQLAKGLPRERDPASFAQHFQATQLEPFYKSANEKGYVKGLAWHRLRKSLEFTGRGKDELLVLDAGSGLGEMSVFVACHGYRVVGVELSQKACQGARALAERVGVAERCSFRQESLEQMSLPDSSIDAVIGRASLHHFIKYSGVPGELMRVMKPGAEGFFADSFGEFKGYHLFHDKQKMERLGDVILTKQLVEDYFEDFELILHPTDWFVMLDKLGQRLLSVRAERLLKGLSRLNFAMDRRIPADSRAALYLSGSLLTCIRKPTS